MREKFSTLATRPFTLDNSYQRRVNSTSVIASPARFRRCLPCSSNCCFRCLVDQGSRCDLTLSRWRSSKRISRGRSCRGKSVSSISPSHLSIAIEDNIFSSIDLQSPRIRPSDTRRVRVQRAVVRQTPCHTRKPSASALCSVDRRSSDVCLVCLERIQYIQRGGGETNRRSARECTQHRSNRQRGQHNTFESQQKQLEIYYHTDYPRSEYLYKSLSFQLMKSGRWSSAGPRRPTSCPCRYRVWPMASSTLRGHRRSEKSLRSRKTQSVSCCSFARPSLSLSRSI